MRVFVLVCAIVMSTLSAKAANIIEVFNTVNGSLTSYNDLPAALAALGQNPGKIVLPSATFSISSPLNLYANQELWGTGNATILATSAMNSTDMIEIQGDAARIHNITIDRDLATVPSPFTGAGVDLNGHLMVRLENVSIMRQYDGIKSSTGSTGPNGFVLKNSFIGWCYNTHVNFWSGPAAIFQCEISGCTFLYSGGTSIKFAMGTPATSSLPEIGMTPIRIEGCIFRLISGSAIYAIGGANLEINKVLMDTLQATGISLYGCARASIVESKITGAGYSIAVPSMGGASPFLAGWARGARISTGSGISIGDSTDVQVANCLVACNSVHGIVIEATNGADTCKNIRIANNTICSNGQYSTASVGSAIYFSGTGSPVSYCAYDHIMITGNRAYNDSVLSANLWQRYGISVGTRTTFSNMIISNNDFLDPNHTASISGITTYIGQNQNY